MKKEKKNWCSHCETRHIVTISTEPLANEQNSNSKKIKKCKQSWTGPPGGVEVSGLPDSNGASLSLSHAAKMQFGAQVVDATCRFVTPPTESLHAISRLHSPVVSKPWSDSQGKAKLKKRKKTTYLYALHLPIERCKKKKKKSKRL